MEVASFAGIILWRDITIHPLICVYMRMCMCARAPRSRNSKRPPAKEHDPSTTKYGYVWPPPTASHRMLMGTVRKRKPSKELLARRAQEHQLKLAAEEAKKRRIETAKFRAQRKIEKKEAAVKRELARQEREKQNQLNAAAAALVAAAANVKSVEAARVATKNETKASGVAKDGAGQQGGDAGRARVAGGNRKRKATDSAGASKKKPLLSSKPKWLKCVKCERKHWTGIECPTPFLPDDDDGKEADTGADSVDRWTGDTTATMLLTMKAMTGHVTGTPVAEGIASPRGPVVGNARLQKEGAAAASTAPSTSTPTPSPTPTLTPAAARTADATAAGAWSGTSITTTSVMPVALSSASSTLLSPSPPSFSTAAATAATAILASAAAAETTADNGSSAVVTAVDPTNPLGLLALVADTSPRKRAASAATGESPAASAPATTSKANLAVPNLPAGMCPWKRPSSNTTPSPSASASSPYSAPKIMISTSPAVPGAKAASTTSASPSSLSVEAPFSSNASPAVAATPVSAGGAAAATSPPKSLEDEIAKHVATQQLAKECIAKQKAKAAQQCSNDADEAKTVNEVYQIIKSKMDVTSSGDGYGMTGNVSKGGLSKLFDYLRK